MKTLQAQPSSPYLSLVKILTKLFRRFNEFTFDSFSSFLADLIERIDIHRTDKVNMKLKTFYESCMDVNQIRTKGFIPGIHFFHF